LQSSISEVMMLLGLPSSAAGCAVRQQTCITSIIININIIIIIMMLIINVVVGTGVTTP
jgi:hypothetical protein